MSRIRLKIPYRATSWSGRSREFTIASPNNRDASMRNSLYNDSRSRSFHSAVARIDCLRWVSHVVPMETVAPANEPSAAARAVTTVESMIQSRQENMGREVGKQSPCQCCKVAVFRGRLNDRAQYGCTASQRIARKMILLTPLPDT